jgi:hypothetical protein
LERKLLNAALVQQGKLISSGTPAYIATLRAQREAASTCRRSKRDQAHQQAATIVNPQYLAFSETIQQSNTIPTQNRNNAPLQSAEPYKLHSSSTNLDQSQGNSSGETS